MYKDRFAEKRCFRLAHAAASGALDLPPGVGSPSPMNHEATSKQTPGLSFQSLLARKALAGMPERRPLRMGICRKFSHKKETHMEILQPKPINAESHWQNIYSTRNANQVSWYAPQLTHSLRYIQRHASLDDAIIDIGGGASTLPDDLLAAGYRNITVLDIAAPALEQIRHRLGARATQIHWLTGDVTSTPLPAQSYALWHDRAVFHFLIEERTQQRYLEQLSHALRPGGIVVMATFGPEGPTSCSGLPTKRYSAEQLAFVMQKNFSMLENMLVPHATPTGGTQEFLYACLQKKA